MRDKIMEEKPDNNNYSKPAFDSRIPFSNFLVKLREEVHQSSNNINEWRISLRKYYSETKGFIEPTKSTKWLKDFNDIIGRTNLSNQNRNSIYNPEQDMFKLQDDIYTLTTGLFLPMKSDSEDLDFDDW